MKKYSRRHHYLPIFYLKGFSDKNNLIHIYDKEKDTIYIKQKPDSYFYEKHLNNYKFEGEIKFTLEEPFFNPIDTKASQVFAKIRRLNEDNKEQLTDNDKFEVLKFITQLFWRLPESDKIFVEIIKKEGLSNKYFGFYKIGETKPLLDADIEIIKTRFLNDGEIQKIFKHTIPLAYISQDEFYQLYYKWRLYSLKVKTPNIIIGDSPFLINNDSILIDNIFNELIFPISKNQLLTLSDNSPNFLDAILMTNVNLSILHQSKRFIASDSEENLKQLLVYYNILVQKNLNKSLIKDTFGLMYYQSKFKNHDEYYKEYEVKKAQNFK